MFCVKLAISSIHLCIHNHLDQNTEKDMGIIVCRLLHDDVLLLAAYQPIVSIIPRIFIGCMQMCVQSEVDDPLYPFIMHPSSLGSKYREKYGHNGLQATAAWCSPGSILPTKDRSFTPRYLHSICKHEFNVKLATSSIHLCIHNHLDQNTEKDMGIIVCRLLHDDVLLLVVYQPIVSIIPSNIHRMHANLCSEWSGWSPLSIHVFIIKHTSRGDAITTTTTIMMMRTTSTTTTLCPKSTWTQIKWSQIHLNVLISTKFPYIASTPTCKA